MIERFADEENGGFFETSDDHEQLVARRKDLEDHPIPSGNSSAAYGLLRLAAAHRRARVRAAAPVGVLRLLHELAAAAPAGVRRTCSRRSTSTSRPCKEVALVGDDLEPLERVVRGALPPPPRARRRRARRRAAARGPRRRSTAAPPPTCASASPARRRSPSRRSCARLLSLAALGLLVPSTPPVDAIRGHRISAGGPAAGGERGRGPRPPAHGADLQRAGLRVAIQGFAVPGHGRSRNVIGIARHTPPLSADRDGPHRFRARRPRARTTTRPASACSRRSRGRLRPHPIRAATSGWWPPARRSASTPAPPTTSARWRSRAGRERTGRGGACASPCRSTRWGATARSGCARRPRRPGPAWRAPLLRAARRARCPCAGCATRSTGNSDHREFELLGLPGAKLGVGAGDEPCRHTPCDRPSRLDRASLETGPASCGEGPPSPLGRSAARALAARAPDHAFLM